MKKNKTYKSASLSEKTIEYIQEVERSLSQQLGKDITLVAYAREEK